MPIGATSGVEAEIAGDPERTGAFTAPRFYFNCCHRNVYSKAFMNAVC
jgi:hypothetical protein